jgi:hypothetical protein
VLNALVSLTFDPEPRVQWRAVEALGVAAARVAEDSPPAVRNLLRRLHWLISEESGGICWFAPQAMAEIIRQCPNRFPAYVSIVVSLLTEMAEEDLDHFRPGILWAIGRLAAAASGEAQSVMPSIVASLADPTPQARGMAVWCLWQIGRRDDLASRPGLLEDEGAFDLYENRRLVRSTVCDLTKRVLADAPSLEAGDSR